jgi:hypothetical protein
MALLDQMSPFQNERFQKSFCQFHEVSGEKMRIILVRGLIYYIGGLIYLLGV